MHLRVGLRRVNKHIEFGCWLCPLHSLAACSILDCHAKYETIAPIEPLTDVHTCTWTHYCYDQPKRTKCVCSTCTLVARSPAVKYVVLYSQCVCEQVLEPDGTNKHNALEWLRAGFAFGATRRPCTDATESMYNLLFCVFDSCLNANLCVFFGFRRFVISNLNFPICSLMQL